jgi:hypothetical protein
VTRRLLVVAVAGLLFVACSSGDDEESSTGPTGTHVTTTVVSSSTTAFTGQITPVSTLGSQPTRVLRDVRVGAHDGFDRVVFEFESTVPGYAVRYIDRPVTEDASGREVAVAGDAVLGVRFEPAHGGDLTRVAGPRGAVNEVVRTGDFEAVLSWAIGVKTKAPFNAYTSEGNKLIIDIGAP